ncbi:cupin domain-containing protein [Actinomadura sp. LD22]|uniref:Cupin domain-containing protein n=1 Tax=Actinomadura physcomitrii TaxID=2650748 RepID=A0A6I4MAN8_9ACTN|nr:cupin domain-containing protein [Actinomadura physcomitrii]MWA01314.1 cupin domain-containing protein [Actinomadura physcomitrii]
MTHSGTTSRAQAAQLTVLRPGAGRVGDLGAIGVQFKLFGADTGDQVAIVEHPFPVGALVPPHRHTREDEFSIVTAGEIGFRSGDEEAVLGEGGYISKPRGELHAMWNAGDMPGRMIEVISPAGFEHFFLDLADLVAGGPPEPAAIDELAGRYGLSFGRPDWLPGLIDRYDLTPPPFG